MFTKFDDSLSPKDLLALLAKIVTMNHHEAEDFQQRLNEPARISSFDYGELAEKFGNLEVYHATANATEAYFNGSYLSDRETNLPVSIVKEENGIFEFIIQNLGGTDCHLLSCHVKRKHQGQNKSQDMIKAIKDICFNHWGYKKIYGRAGIARVDEGVMGAGDWRQAYVQYKDEQMQGLMRFWLKQEDVYPLTDFEPKSDKDKFVILPKGI
jgi:hypothetical protein